MTNGNVYFEGDAVVRANDDFRNLLKSCVNLNVLIVVSLSPVFKAYYDSRFLCWTAFYNFLFSLQTGYLQHGDRYSS